MLIHRFEDQGKELKKYRGKWASVKDELDRRDEELASCKLELTAVKTREATTIQERDNPRVQLIKSDTKINVLSSDFRDRTCDFGVALATLRSESLSELEKGKLERKTLLKDLDRQREVSKAYQALAIRP
ncbi:hypothetical protein M5689_012693 [Euphorbia peplus]|nr:hypothetical protein M5689_012693 [Euphorbia peplus]